jgi:hypothetical protein
MARSCLGVGGRHRLLREVARGHHQWAVEPPEQQVVEWRIREQNADQRIAGGDLGGEGGVRKAVEEDDWTFDRGEQVLLGRREASQALHRREVANHDRERLLVPVLPLPQAADRAAGAGVAGELVASQSFDRHDLPFVQGPDGDRQSVLDRRLHRVRASRPRVLPCGRGP